MKELLSLTGGYKRHIDYLLKLQSEVYGVQNSLFKNLGHDLVLAGCEVTDNLNGTVNIASGVIYCEGEVVRFAGASNVISNGSKALKKGVPITSEPKQFQDESVKNIYKETFAIVADKISEASQIVIRTKQLYTIESYIQDVIAAYAIKGEIKDIYDFEGNFLSNFDTSGLGITPRYIGWALFNGNNGTPDGRGRVRLTAGFFYDGFSSTYTTYSHGDRGGARKHELSIDEMPVHKHRIGTQDLVGASAGGSSSNIEGTRSDLGGIGTDTTETGGGEAHNNMQPYIAVYTIIKIA